MRAFCASKSLHKFSVIVKMILYVIMLCFHTCQSEEVIRLEAGDKIKDATFCRDCTCPAAHSTYYNLTENKRCVHASELGMIAYFALLPLRT